jgi:uncharacterized protein DUF6065
VSVVATPRLTAYCTNPSPSLRLRPAWRERAWMEATDRRFANRCLPLLIANQAGWFLVSDQTVRVIWTGGRSAASLRVELLRGIPPCCAISHFGHGILTWHVPFVFRTPPGYNLLVRGPANWPKDGACALEGSVETDWSYATFTMNWQLTRRRHAVTFEAGEPIAMLVPHRRQELEAFQPELRDISSDPEIREHYEEWAEDRAWFNDLLRRPGSAEQKRGWEKHYFQGRTPSDDEGPMAGHQTKLTLREFGRRS